MKGNRDCRCMRQARNSTTSHQRLKEVTHAWKIARSDNCYVPVRSIKCFKPEKRRCRRLQTSERENSSGSVKNAQWLHKSSGRKTGNPTQKTASQAQEILCLRIERLTDKTFTGFLYLSLLFRTANASQSIIATQFHVVTTEAALCDTN